MKYLFAIATIASSLALGACSNTPADVKTETSQQTQSIENEKTKIDLEKQKLELDKERLELEKKKVAMNEQKVEAKNNQEVLEKAKKAREIEYNPEVVVTSAQAFFYDRADDNFRRRAYMVKGDRFTALKVVNNFVYTEYYNADANKTTKGWIRIEDITTLR